MKVAICARGEGLQAEVDQRFGRCPYFVIVDSESGKVIESLPNASVSAAGGAGPQSTRQLADHSVEAVVVGNVGPNAAVALEAAKVKVYTGIEGTVEKTLQKFKEGKLSSVSNATVPSHDGMRKKW
ncbi:MAG: NifB/NifX family molybdenum-iron cluster-binding protein [Bacillota bacterium]